MQAYGASDLNAVRAKAVPAALAQLGAGVRAVNAGKDISTAILQNHTVGEAYCHCCWRPVTGAR